MQDARYEWQPDLRRDAFMNVWISIKGVQHADGESNSLEFDTLGFMERTKDGYCLTYQETETTGMEGVTTSMVVNKSAVTLKRQGALNSLMVLEKGKRTLCDYDTGFGRLTMGVYARDIQSSLADCGGNFNFHYTLDINSGMASAHDVYVSVRAADPKKPVIVKGRRRTVKCRKKSMSVKER